MSMQKTAGINTAAIKNILLAITKGTGTVATHGIAGAAGGSILGGGIGAQIGGLKGLLSSPAEGDGSSRTSRAVAGAISGGKKGLVEGAKRGAGMGAGMGLAKTVYNQLYPANNQSWKQEMNPVDTWRQIQDLTKVGSEQKRNSMNSVAYLTGYMSKEALASELVNALKDVGIGAGAGALAGGAYGATKSKLNEGEIDKGETAKDALIGAGVGGAVGGAKAAFDNRAKLLEMLKGIVGGGSQPTDLSPA